MNLEALVTEVLTPVLDHPEALRVEQKEDGRKLEVLIFAEARDRGRIIGKGGRMITSLRTLAKVAGEKAGGIVNLELYDGDEPRRGGPEAPEAEA